jgi:hypothetical protein
MPQPQPQHLPQEIDMERAMQDPAYREELAQALLARCGQDADHVELRRTAVRLFPELARQRTDSVLASIVGHAATMRVQQLMPSDRDVTDARLEMTATEPLDYPAAYQDLPDPLRATVIRFCEDELRSGRNGPEALSNLLKRHGWPYSERTFYVGPWKAARLRQRRRDDD